MREHTTFLVDGFNLYHSIRDIKRFSGGSWLKWLNVSSFCASFLHRIGNADLKSIYYFSAYAYHLNNPNLIIRHETYLKCLEDTGVQTIMSRFKPKDVTCSLFQACSSKVLTSCSGVFVKHEEKETDVAIACKLLALLAKGDSDCIVLVTGDTDLAPVITSAKSLYPTKRVLCAFPYRRANAQLKQMCPQSFNIKVKDYQLHQFPDPYPMSDGTSVAKPSTW